MLCREVHPLKAHDPIAVTLSGIVIRVTDLFLIPVMVLPSSERINILSIITLGECISYKSILFTLSFEDSLAARSVGQHKVRRVAGGTYIDHLIRGDTHQSCTGRYSEPLHPSCIYSANIRFFMEIDEK